MVNQRAVCVVAGYRALIVLPKLVGNDESLPERFAERSPTSRQKGHHPVGEGFVVAERFV
ncbi:MAG TPA: hypothetical protein VMS31_17505 [Pyrinomonadaceae bacterium]|nr:hypothetical protein [Pyrinomonadaceae bacterium]